MAVYKYSCRKCPIRNRCIRESKYNTSVKDMTRNAFEARTDTLSTWGLLQSNCLLIKAEEEQERKARQESTLRRRLREARETKRQAAAEARAKKSGKDTDPLIRHLSKAKEIKRKSTEELANAQAINAESKETAGLPAYLKPGSSPLSYSPTEEERPDTIGTSDADEVQAPGFRGFTQKSSKPCWLTIKGSGRHIMLPGEGTLTLGRFDAAFGIPPDIDLAYEDGDNRTVSRRHVKVAGLNGYHTIEDTGSRYGVVVNGNKIKPGLPHHLTPGDRLAVGNVQMFYDQIPEYMQGAPKNSSVNHVFIVTPTGRKIKIAPPLEATIGRSDPYIDFVPEIDLTEDGESAVRVSRRHAIIQWHNDQPYLEDLGSGFGTRVNGKMVLIGQSVRLKPGDHIWLGGCVLAYDIEL